MSAVVTDDSGDVTDLLRRATDGDNRAAERLFAHYRDRLKRMVHLRLSRRLP
jgi:RNA polymerase sigma-70 factor (ECF subfamily)